VIIKVGKAAFPSRIYWPSANAADQGGRLPGCAAGADLDAASQRSCGSCFLPCELVDGPCGTSQGCNPARLQAARLQAARLQAAGCTLQSCRQQVAHSKAAGSRLQAASLQVAGCNGHCKAAGSKAAGCRWRTQHTLRTQRQSSQRGENFVLLHLGSQKSLHLPRAGACSKQNPG
jgi:hypothetical protein